MVKLLRIYSFSAPAGLPDVTYALHDKVKDQRGCYSFKVHEFLLLNFRLLDNLFQQIDVTGKRFVTGLGQ